MADDKLIKKAKELVAKSKKMTALTGAGISVGSGIPDFKSEGGIWTRFDPLEYASYDSFLKDPSKFWTMGQEIAQAFLKATPNMAHKTLSKLESDGKLIGVITLNIDNLHQAAGSKNVIELRGNYLKAYCMSCGQEYFGTKIQQRVAEGEIPPICDECKGVLKSEAVLFGEPLPKDNMAKAIDLCRKTDLMFVIGSSLQVYPAAYLPQLAKNSGAKIVLINLEGRNRHNMADIVLKGKATDIVHKLVET
ncbi:MAG: SIR2 family NAD-dependent protein deacylase [Candidatus Thorarchaeota archaeon]|jgi:NAD-dependent deacetylase